MVTEREEKVPASTNITDVVTHQSTSFARTPGSAPGSSFPVMMFGSLSTDMYVIDLETSAQRMVDIVLPTPQMSARQIGEIAPQLELVPVVLTPDEETQEETLPVPDQAEQEDNNDENDGSLPEHFECVICTQRMHNNDRAVTPCCANELCQACYLRTRLGLPGQSPRCPFCRTDYPPQVAVDINDNANNWIDPNPAQPLVPAAGAPPPDWAYMNSAAGPSHPQVAATVPIIASATSAPSATFYRAVFIITTVITLLSRLTWTNSFVDLAVLFFTLSIALTFGTRGLLQFWASSHTSYVLYSERRFFSMYGALSPHDFVTQMRRQPVILRHTHRLANAVRKWDSMMLNAAVASGLASHVETGVLHHLATALQPLTENDLRQTNIRHSLAVDYRVAYNLCVFESREENTAKLIITSPELVTQVVQMISMQPTESRALTAHSRARIGASQLMIDSAIVSEVIHGSALVAMVMANNQDAAAESLLRALRLN